jgi:hypothetical protein
LFLVLYEDFPFTGRRAILADVTKRYRSPPLKQD